MAKFAVILPAAGSSSRFGDKNYKKPFASLAGQAVWLHAAERFVNRADVVQVLLVIAAEDMEAFREKFSANVAILDINVVRGGVQRSDSVRNALAKVLPAADYVAIHDAARPCLADKWIDQVFSAAQSDGAAILAMPVTGTLKSVGQGHMIEHTLDRQGMWEAQTPQVFRRDLIEQAYAKGNASATDDSQLVEQLGHSVTIVPGSPLNRKITTREDLKMAESLLKLLPSPHSSGMANPFADDDLWK